MWQDSNWHSTEGDKRDDLSDNKWFNSTQKLAGDKKFIKKTGNWACESCLRAHPARCRTLMPFHSRPICCFRQLEPP